MSPSSPSSFFPRSLLLSLSCVHTSVALHSEVCLLALRFSPSLSRICFLFCPSCHSQFPSHHFQLCNFHFSNLSFRYCHRFHSMTSLTTLLYILPLTLTDNFLLHRTPDTFFQLIHSAWILILTSSHLPSLLTVEPRYLKFFAFFPFSSCSFNSSRSSTFLAFKYSALLRFTFRLFSPVHFSKSPDHPLASYDFS